MDEVYAVVMPLETLALLVGVSIALVVAVAEYVHGRRIARVARLAFGVRGRARRWAASAGPVRVIGAGLMSFGLVVLGMQAPEFVETRPTTEASKHLLVCLDASPSMFVEDAGPSGTEKRAIWAGELIQAILDRLDTETTRVTVYAVYTDSIPVIEATFDTNVVRNALDGLPLYAAFRPGPTRLTSGVAEALEYARRWETNSATLVVISDGDSEDQTPIRYLPSSVADAIVIGVGDPHRPTLIAGHRSKQDSGSLRSLAGKLEGIYYDGNQKHLPSSVLNELTMIRPRVTDAIGLRELALACVGLGGGLLLLIGPALALFGRKRSGMPIRSVSTPSGGRIGADPGPAIA